MSTTLVREPLPTSFSLTAGPTVTEFTPADERHQPFAYVYSQWDVKPADPDLGRYDEDTQTWSFPPDTPIAGIVTRTTTHCYNTDTCTDEICS